MGNSTEYGLAITKSGKVLGPARCSLQVAQDRVLPVLQVIDQWHRHLVTSEETSFPRVLAEVARRTSLPAVQLFAACEMERQVTWNGCVGILQNERFDVPAFAVPAFKYLGYDKIAELARRFSEEIDTMMAILHSDVSSTPPNDLLDSVLREIDEAFFAAHTDMYHKDGPAWIQSNPEAFDIKPPAGLH